MKRVLILLLATSIIIVGFSQSPGRSIAIIPEPVSIKHVNGIYYSLPTTINIVTSDNDEVKKIGDRLANQLSTALKRKVTVNQGIAKNNNTILLAIDDTMKFPKGGYLLGIDRGGVRLKANEPAGIFYGIQTLLQLFPKEVETVNNERSDWKLPYVIIEDHPRFGWRGLMLDVSRHFFTVAQVKQYIDVMVKYKFNLLHLHLTDDQGWRIEIKSLPKLTEVGAWRVERTGTFGNFSPPTPGEPRTYGGFYTHDDIRELVKYAAERYVDILPEIDVPGHSLAAIAAYPELSCTPGNYYVSPGDRFMVWPGGGQHFYGLLDNTICPANEKSYEFMDKVFTEVAQLFPFEYIHMGGDETARNFWEKTDAIKAMMQREKLKDLDEVQSYFVKRMEKIIRSKGKKMIGWDEILQGGLAPNAAVMSWRGMNGGIEAAKLGHEVVMSPTQFAYIDYMQGDAIIEPPVYETLRLKKAYQFEPVPEGINTSLIKGGQANLWTEQVYNMRHAQYMTWPRGFAIAEALWSPKEKRDWNNFVSRVEKHFDRLDAADIKYAPSMYDPIFETSKQDTTVIVKLSTEVEGLNIHYSFDNSFPDQHYPKYTAPLTVPKDASFLKVITYRDDKPKGRMIVMPVDELRKRVGLKKK